MTPHHPAATSGSLAGVLAEEASLRPDHPALVARHEVLTYGALDAEARRFAGALRALGIGAGARVAVVLPNVSMFSVAYFGCQYAGCVVVPLHPMLTAPELTYHFDDAAVAAVVSGGEQAAAVHLACRTSRTVHHLVWGTDHDAGPDRDLGTLLAASAPIGAPAPVDPNATAVVLYTSGTTGKPKGAELAHRSLRWNAEYMGRHFMPDGRDTVALAALPLFHSFGQTVIQNATFTVGGTVVLLPRFAPGTALEAIEAHRVTLFAGVPTMYIGMLRHPAFARERLRSLTVCISGGAAMPVEVLQAFEQSAGLAIHEGYGLSETSPVAAQNRIGRPRVAGSIGVPLDGVAFRLTDDAGRVAIGPDVVGELEIQGPLLFKGYLDRPDETAAAFNDGWFRTGDLARRDAAGNYFIVDRKKDLILRGGMNVYPREVEEVLYQHSAVAEAAVFGRPDDLLGEVVCAAVVLTPGAAITPAELVGHCRTRLAPFKVPRTVEILDALPRGPSGKILRRALREEGRGTGTRRSRTGQGSA